MKQSTLLPALAFGRFERINLRFGLVGFGCYMGGQVAVAVFPFQSGIRAGAAVPATGKLGTPFAAVTFFDDLVADAAIVGAAFWRHKGALGAFFNCCAVHWNHPLPALNDETKNMRLKLSKTYANLDKAQKRGNIIGQS
jgi:hypothetical protein